MQVMYDVFLIDGYNLLHALGMVARDAGPGGLDKARQRLLDFLADAFGDNAGRVHVVFDAQHARRGALRIQTHRGVHVEFAPSKESADDRIEDLIARSPQPRKMVVVSNDARLQSAAHRRNAIAWSHEKLLDFLDRPPPAAANEAGDDRSGAMSPEEVKEWVKEFEDIGRDAELRDFLDQDRFE
jgi:predicted RNA-binding protein with PIN domain